MTDHFYYLVQTGDDRYDVRQTRYKAQYLAGSEHPHDLMSTGFTAAQVRELIAKRFLVDIDMTTIPAQRTKQLFMLCNCCNRLGEQSIIWIHDSKHCTCIFLESE